METEIAPDLQDSEPSPHSREQALTYIKKIGDQLELGPASDGLFSSMRSPSTFVVAAEEMSRVWPSLTMTLISCFPVDLIRWASRQTREAYAEQLDTGELIGCLAVTEPGSGSDTSRPATTATLKGDHYEINGQKTWISSASIADVALVVAYDEAEDQRDFFVVDKKTSGFETESIDKLGWHGSPTGQIFFENCKVPIENKAVNVFANLLDESDALNGTFLSPDRLLNQENPLNVVFSFLRSCMAAMSAGISQRALDMTRDFLTDRRDLSQQQFVHETLFEMKASLESSRRLAYRAAEFVENGKPDARQAASLAKAHATEDCINVTGEALSLLDGHGAAEYYPIERFHRDARMMTIPDGTTEIQTLITGYELTGHSAYT
jgi:alkylation response protein AidB-like acyl-CoA dehydrogenase